jgi:hypothetical protein
MTQTHEQIDLASLIDFNAPVICDSRRCAVAPEVAVAMIVYKNCPCRFPVGLACIQRILLYASKHVERGAFYTSCARCGTNLYGLPASMDFIRFIAL